MNIAAEHARLTAVGLPVSETLPNSICPICHGGAHQEKTFSVTRYPSKLAYICYRDSCSTRGYVDDEGRTDFRHEHGLNKGGSQTLKPYTGSIRFLKDRDLTYFRDRFHIPPSVSIVSIRLGDHDTYLFPIINEVGHWVGFVQRQPVWKGLPEPVRSNPDWNGPKALTKQKEPGEAISFHRADGTSPEMWILVEDSVSAIKLSAYGYNAVALLSTNVNLAKIRLIQDAGAKQIIIALDADATSTAFKIAKDYGLAFDYAKVRIMRQDPKDTDPEEFYELFGG